MTSASTVSQVPMGRSPPGANGVMPGRPRSAPLTRMRARSAVSVSAVAAVNPALRGAGTQGADKVNLTTADAATIDRVLLNVGPSKAQAIVD
mgnify:CR=1 FL=1